MSSRITAIKRNKLSAPARWLHENEKLSVIMLDYGSGRGEDARILCDDYGYYCSAYDPYWADEPVLLEYHYEVVMCNYVLNVLSPDERQAVIDKLLSLDTDCIYATVRRDLKQGYIKTGRGTEQWLVKLDYPILKKTAGFCIYRLK